MLLEHYEEALKEIEELDIGLDNLSNNELRQVLRSIVNKGWLQIETMFGAKQNKKHSKEEIQEHFNKMLNVVPMTKIKRISDKA
jgi:hypothetical protein